MTLGLRVNDPIRFKLTGLELVSIILRTALESEDSFEEIPEDVLKDLIRRIEEE
jgi:hypothetical protein